MLATLAIINMAVAAVLINDTVEFQAAPKEPAVIVATLETETKTIK